MCVRGQCLRDYETMTLSYDTQTHSMDLEINDRYI
jgi:hypothetical protein